ncbi:MAG TPA: efflux RND transporter periplasmic adaptor subunit [Anaeromyxobacteraceae bacterium]|nr:efflux RND transporter periplasmic adaptor subunit [Anaeromyxobacteraceae bacterium]
MKTPSRRTLVIAGTLVPLGLLLAFVAIRSGPLAPVPVTVATVEAQPVAPALFGVGTVEARYAHRVGPTAAGRVLRVDVQVGDRVRAGQMLAELEPVDLDARLVAQQAALARAEANVLAAEAQLADTRARAEFAKGQADRYGQLARAGATSEELFETKRHEQLAADAAVLSARAALTASREEVQRARAEADATRRLRANLRLVAPVDGLVTARNADPGSTVVAGQALVEIVDPATLWVNVRFDQLRASGLRPDLPARIALRSRAGEPLAGRTARIEPVADAVTEEILAKVVFATLPDPLPAIGELAEVTVALPESPAAPVVSNASLQRVSGRLGVWTLDSHDDLRFVPVKTGAADLDGRVQILDGLAGGERVVVHSQRALRSGTRIDVATLLPGAPR